MPMSRFAVSGLLVAACMISLLCAADTASGTRSTDAGLVADEAADDYTSWAADPATAWLT